MMMYTWILGLEEDGTKRPEGWGRGSVQLDQLENTDSYHQYMI